MKLCYAFPPLPWAFVGCLLLAYTASAQNWAFQRIDGGVLPIKAIDENTAWAGAPDGVF